MSYGSPYAPRVTCPTCGVTYKQHWASVRFIDTQGRRISNPSLAMRRLGRSQPSIRTDTHQMACARRTPEERQKARTRIEAR